jgi:hypothetical protein
MELHVLFHPSPGRVTTWLVRLISQLYVVALISVQVVPFLKYWSLQLAPFAAPAVQENVNVFALDEWVSESPVGFACATTHAQTLALHGGLTRLPQQGIGDPLTVGQ